MLPKTNEYVPSSRLQQVLAFYLQLCEREACIDLWEWRLAPREPPPEPEDESEPPSEQ